MKILKLVNRTVYSAYSTDGLDLEDVHEELNNVKDSFDGYVSFEIDQRDRFITDFIINYFVEVDEPPTEEEIKNSGVWDWKRFYDIIN